MSTILLSGLGDFGSWALEILARTPGVDRIVSVKRNPWAGASRSVLAMLGSVFQGYAKTFEHYQLDLADTDALVRLLDETRPDAILHSATIRSPRQLMRVDLDPGVRDVIRSATFGMWLPWHMLPATHLTEAIDRSGLEIHVINAAFPDVVNVALWKRYGHGPTTGVGNVEVCAAQVLRYVMEVSGAQMEDIDVSLVGSHALLSDGPQIGVPYYFNLRVKGRDVTDEYDLNIILRYWPEPIEWREVDVFSVFAASGVKNVMALIGPGAIRTHVTSPMGLPGGYPAWIGDGRVNLDLPSELSYDEAVGINERANRLDGIQRVDSDGTVVYTDEARAAMAELGYRWDAVTFADLSEQSEQLEQVYESLIAKGRADA